MWKQHKHLALLIIFILALHVVVSNHSPRFLQETVPSEDTNEEKTHENTEGGHEEEGIELHYSFGTKGFYICILISIFLTLFAGIMSGLTVGLLSIDTLELEMKMIHGTEEQK